MHERTHPVTVRLDQALHREATAVARVTGGTFRELVEAGLRHVLDERLKNVTGLAAAVDVVVGFRQNRAEEAS